MSHATDTSDKSDAVLGNTSSSPIPLFNVAGAG